VGGKPFSGKHAISIKLSGIYPLSHFEFQHEEPLVLKTLFTQLMLEKGFLASTIFYASYAHKELHTLAYLNAADEAFAFISQAVQGGNPQQNLHGPICHAGFKRLN